MTPAASEVGHQKKKCPAKHTHILGCYNLSDDEHKITPSLPHARKKVPLPEGCFSSENNKEVGGSPTSEVFKTELDKKQD